jgi:hypothetical protein
LAARAARIVTVEVPVGVVAAVVMLSDVETFAVVIESVLDPKTALAPVGKPDALNVRVHGSLLPPFVTVTSP